MSVTYFATGNLNVTNLGNRTGILGKPLKGRNLTAKLNSVC